MRKNMTELERVIISEIPEEEAGYIRDCVKKDGGLKLVSADTREKWKKELQISAENGLLITGKREVLEAAAQLNMAAVCYENTERRAEGGCPDPYPPAVMVVEGFREVDARFLKRAFQRHHHIPWKILETRRCIVRELGMNDLDALFELYSYSGMTDYMEGLYPYEQERAYQKAYIEHMYGFYGYGMWLVFEKSSGKLIGRAGVEHREETCGLELGYAIAPPFQRQGYATEVCSAILNYVKTELEFSEISCLISEHNKVSVHLAEKLGFSYQTYLMMEGKKMLKYYRRI